MFIFREAIQKFCLADENFVSFLAHCAKVPDFIRNGRKIPQASANAGLRCGGVHMVFQIGRLAGAEDGMKKFRTARRARRRHMDRRNCSPGTQELCSCQLQKAVQSVSRFAVSGKIVTAKRFSRQTLRRAYPMPHPAAFAFENSIVVLCGLRQFPWRRFSEKPQKIAHFFALNIYHIIYAARLFICLIF